MISRNGGGVVGGSMILLHDIRSVHNVGSIFRTADGAGVTKIFLSGTTPAPVDRFGRARPDIAKVALGAEKSVAWEVITDPVALVKDLKKKGVRIVALEQDKRSIDSRLVIKFTPTLLILGNEVNGVQKEFLDLAHVIAEIPMLGEKESLNLSVSAGIMMSQIFF